MRIRFGLRFALATLLIFAMVFSWVVYHVRNGHLERTAAISLSNAGVVVLRNDQENSITVEQPFTIYTGVHSSSPDVFVIRNDYPIEDSSWTTLLTDFQTRFSTAVITQKCKMKHGEIAKLLKQIPSLRTIYVDPNSLSSMEIRGLQSEFEALEFKIDGLLVRANGG
jgi:hypothetical protein